jgi:hypothetical protein
VLVIGVDLRDLGPQSRNAFGLLCAARGLGQQAEQAIELVALDQELPQPLDRLLVVGIRAERSRQRANRTFGIAARKARLCRAGGELRGASQIESDPGFVLGGFLEQTFVREPFGDAAEAAHGAEGLGILAECGAKGLERRRVLGGFEAFAEPHLVGGNADWIGQRGRELRVQVLQQRVIVVGQRQRFQCFQRTEVARQEIENGAERLAPAVADLTLAVAQARELAQRADAALRILQHARLGSVNRRKRVPGAGSGVQRLEGEQRLELDGVAFEHGLETTDRPRGFAQIIAIDLPGAQQRRHRKPRIGLNLGFALERLDQSPVISLDREQADQTLARGAERWLEAECLLVRGQRTIRITQAVFEDFADAQAGARLGLRFVESGDLELEQAHDLVPAPFLFQLAFERAACGALRRVELDGLPVRLNGFLVPAELVLAERGDSEMQGRDTGPGGRDRQLVLVDLEQLLMAARALKHPAQRGVCRRITGVDLQQSLVEADRIHVVVHPALGDLTRTRDDVELLPAVAGALCLELERIDQLRPELGALGRALHRVERADVLRRDLEHAAVGEQSLCRGLQRLFVEVPDLVEIGDLHLGIRRGIDRAFVERDQLGEALALAEQAHQSLEGYLLARHDAERQRVVRDRVFGPLQLLLVDLGHARMRRRATGRLARRLGLGLMHGDQRQELAALLVKLGQRLHGRQVRRSERAGFLVPLDRAPGVVEPRRVKLGDLLVVRQALGRRDGDLGQALEHGDL